jgi:hypothetical protein
MLPLVKPRKVSRSGLTFKRFVAGVGMDQLRARFALLLGASLLPELSGLPPPPRAFRLRAPAFPFAPPLPPLPPVNLLEDLSFEQRKFVLEVVVVAFRGR